MYKQQDRSISTSNILWIVSIIAITLAMCSALASQAASNTKNTRTVYGRVQRVGWQQSTAIEEWQEATLEDWKDNIADGEKILSCQYQERPQSLAYTGKTHEVCETRKVYAGYRGGTKLVKDCHVEFDVAKPVYAAYCTYTGKKWQIVSSVSSQGKDLNLYAPTVKLTENQREGPSESTYTVWFDTPDGIKEFKTDSEDLFKQCQIGSQWILKIQKNFSLSEKIESIQPQPSQ